LKELLTPKLLKRLEAFQLHTRRSFLGQRQGIHRSIRRGHGLEFDDYRLYTPGDDYRYIDWGVYARTDKLYLKQFKEEQDLNVSILVDSSKSMLYSKDKFEFSKAIGLALGYIALSSGDNLRYCFLGSASASPTYFGIKSFKRAVSDVSSAAASGSFDWSLAIRKVMDRQKIPGRCFIVSDFLYEQESIISALDYLRSRGFEVSLVHLTSPDELNLELTGNIVVRDAETNEEIELSLDQSSKKEYQKKYREHFDFLNRYCKKTGIISIEVSSVESLSEVVFGKFLKQGLLC
jgi:uncharacterized protein (DUF58 family)